LEKQLATPDHPIAMFVENRVRMKAKLQAAERRVEEAEEKAEERWKAWAEKEAQAKAGKACWQKGRSGRQRARHCQARW